MEDKHDLRFRFYKMTALVRDEFFKEKFYIKGVLKKIKCWKWTKHLQGKGAEVVAGR